MWLRPNNKHHQTQAMLSMSMHVHAFGPNHQKSRFIRRDCFTLTCHEISNVGASVQPQVSPLRWQESNLIRPAAFIHHIVHSHASVLTKGVKRSRVYQFTSLINKAVPSTDLLACWVCFWGGFYFGGVCLFWDLFKALETVVCERDQQFHSRSCMLKSQRSQFNSWNWCFTGTWTEAPDLRLQNCREDQLIG